MTQWVYILLLCALVTQSRRTNENQQTAAAGSDLLTLTANQTNSSNFKSIFLPFEVRISDFVLKHALIFQVKENLKAHM